MKKNGLLRITAILALLGLVMVMGMGCNDDAGSKDGKTLVIRTVTVSPTDMIGVGVVFSDESGTLNYSIKIDGDNISSISLTGNDVQIGVVAGDAITPVQGITIDSSTPNVTAANTDSALKIAVSGITAPTGTTYQLVVRVRGVTSNVFQLRVSPPSPVTSVVVALATNPGKAEGYKDGTLNYTIRANSVDAGLFPVNFASTSDIIRFRFVDDGDEKQLPAGITVNAGSIAAPNADSPLVFSVNMPAGTYKLAVYVYDRKSNEFELEVEESDLNTFGGEVHISGDYFEIGDTLTAVVEGLPGTAPLSYKWRRFADLFDEVGVVIGTDSNTYTLVKEDGTGTSYIQVEVTRPGFKGSVLSDTQGPIPNFEDPALQGRVDIDFVGELGVGTVLTAVTTNISGGATEIYHWERSHKDTPATFATISGAGNNQTYTIRQADVNHHIRITVTSLGFSSNIRSEPTDLVPPNSIIPQIEALLETVPVPAEAELVAHINETIPPQVFDFGGSEIEITIKGDAPGRNLTLASIGSMFTINAGVTLILEDIELKGINNNNRALVKVNEDGILVMEAGSKITGNTNTSGWPNCGGGVATDEGEFIMNAGEISGNEADEGGGVFNQFGYFEMNGGLITGNHAEDEGGGVTSESGLFFLLGGEISGNTTGGAGGGVSTGWGGGFGMESGIINNNQAISGGGVFVNNHGLFIMDGGVISNNRAQGAAGSNGGGVHVQGSAANATANFMLLSGTISGNTSVQAGGGVCSWSHGWFSQYGGTISGNSSQFGGGVSQFGAGWYKMSGGIISSNTAIQGGGINNQGASATVQSVFAIDTGIIYGLDAPANLRNIATGSANAWAAALLTSTANANNMSLVLPLDEDHNPLVTSGPSLGSRELTIDVAMPSTGEVADRGNNAIVRVNIPDWPTKYVSTNVIGLWAVIDGSYLDLGGFMMPANRNFLMNFPVIPGNWELEFDIFPNQSDWQNDRNLIATYSISKNLVRGTNAIPYAELEESTSPSPNISANMIRMVRPSIERHELNTGMMAQLTRHNFDRQSIPNNIASLKKADNILRTHSQMLPKQLPAMQLLQPVWPIR